MEKNTHILTRSIEGLRQTEGPDIWSSIVVELTSREENKEVLSQSVQSLAQHQAPDVWMEVSSGLSAKSGKRWKYYAAAASLVLIGLVSVLLVPKQAEEITYSTEQVDFFEVGQRVTGYNGADDVLLSYIKENCVRLAATCQDPEFKSLLEMYMELDVRKEELNKALQLAPDQTKVMKYLIKVEKNQTEIGKDMLKKMKSI